MPNSALVVGQVFELEATERVVHDRRGEPDVGIVGHAGRLERMFVNASTKARIGTRTAGRS
jgi:hypothetical protein